MRQLGAGALLGHPLVAQQKQVEPPYVAGEHPIGHRVACKDTNTITPLGLLAEPVEERQWETFRG